MAVSACVVLMAACAGPVPRTGAADAVSALDAPLELAGVPYAAHWYRPSGPAALLVVMEHGFTRRCRNLDQSMRRLASVGALVLCIDASMAGGNPQLAAALAARLDGSDAFLQGTPLPPRIVVAGHSAGAAFAVAVGAELDRRTPQRLAGVLLVDPVPAAGFEAGLQRVVGQGRRPLLALLARSHACNARLAAGPSLWALQQQGRADGRSDIEVVPSVEGSTHADVEGEDSDWIAALACGRPQPALTEALRERMVSWLRSLVGAAAGSPSELP